MVQNTHLLWVAAVLAFTLWIVGQPIMAAEEKSVTEEIPEVLRSEGKISEEKYQELKSKAKKEQEEKEKDFRVYWKDGLRFQTKDKNFNIKLGGSIQLDAAMIDPDTATEHAFPDLSGNGVEFRRARLYTSGTIYTNYEYKFQLEFADVPDVEFKDVYLGVKNIPYVGHIRVGHQKEPFSLEELTSSNSITFMERSLPTAAFAPGRNTGLLLFNPQLNKRLWWGAGVFKEVDDSGSGFSDHSDWNVSARITGLPWFASETQLLHIGLSYTHKFRSESTDENQRLEFSTRPESHLADTLVNTGELISDGADILNPELALVYGPFSVQGEYYYDIVDRDGDSDLHFSGFYVFASYFITGESRPYDSAKATFGRLRPNKNFDLKGGLGAWEVALRYSQIDLNDEDIQGGEEKNITAGLNW